MIYGTAYGELPEPIREGYTFVQPAPQHKCPSLEYKDLGIGSWYHDYTDYVLEKGLMLGTDVNTFSPNMSLTRAQAVTIFARMCGVDLTEYKNSTFSDVDISSWYGSAIAWADRAGIAIGFDDGCFYPNIEVTREQFSLMLYRMAGNPDSAITLDGFIDGNSVSSWALEAVQWATEIGLMQGDNTGKLHPQSGITQVETAAFLKRLNSKANFAI